MSENFHEQQFQRSLETIQSELQAVQLEPRRNTQCNREMCKHNCITYSRGYYTCDDCGLSSHLILDIISLTVPDRN